MRIEGARGAWGVRVSIALLLLALLLQIVLGARLLSAAFDETTHLPSGYTYWKTGQFRLNPQHPPLVKLLAAAPLLWIEPELDLSASAWQREPPDEWSFGYDFLYRNDADRLLFWGRLPVALLALLLAGYVFRWARDLFGTAAGVLALLLCAFSPTVIAHARFVTFDVGLACFSTMTLYHAWRRARGGGRVHLALAGLGLGLALATKFSAVILLASVVLLLAWSAARPTSPGATPGRRWLNGLIAFAVLAVVALLVVEASYFFTEGPQVWLRGMLQVNQDRSPDYPYYLMGRFYPGGVWYYFLLAFLFKTPLPSLLSLLLAVALLRRFPAEHSLDELFLVVPAVLWFAVTSALAADIGVRYLLPVYPLLFVFVSRLARALPGKLPVRVGAALLAGWYVGAALWIFPDQLAYFNELAGGPSRGHLYLDDSNIDWSQDVKRLARYLDEHDIGTVKLLYGPWIAPGYYGIRAVPLSEAEWAGDPAPGYYALGTHVLIRGAYHARTVGTKTNWLERYEPIGRVGYSIYLFRFDAPSAPGAAVKGGA